MSGPSGGYYNFVGAPHQNLPFPANANMTAVELLTFLPNYLTSADVVYRFASNHTTWDAMVSILDTNRLIETPKVANIADYCQRNMRNAMREDRYEGWTLSKHLERFEQELQRWNPVHLGVGNFRTRFQICGEGRTEKDIPFFHLADGVKTMPQGDDALDLTRIVSYCVQHPSQQWMYPTHYSALLQQLGGEQHPTAASMDREIFARWNDNAPHVSRARQPTEQMQTPGRSSTSESGAEAPRRSVRRGRPSLKKRELLEDDFSGNEISDAQPEDTEYVREPLRWVKPPPTDGGMSIQALEYVFDQQSSRRDDENDDPYNAYAFGDGPRATAPFRPLHLIQGVKCADLSGWAENLRWANEQYLTFEETGWTERPEHMELIVQIRQEQIWASSELFLSIQDNQAQDGEDEAWLETMVASTLGSLLYRAPHPRLSVYGDIEVEQVDYARGSSKTVPRPWPPHR